MHTTFLGIEIARRALQAQQRALDVVGHNIANANTPGYSRQRAIMQTTPPLTGGGFPPASFPGQIGTGVQVAELVRYRDAFIDMQLRHELHTMGEWTARQETLSKLELIVLEPSDVGLRDNLDAFWRALQDLHLNPESEAARAVVRQQGIALTDTFRHLAKQLDDLQMDLDRSLVVAVQQINSHLEELARLNQQIRQVVNVGQNPNDLLDRRDLLLRQLSELTQVSAFEQPDGTIRVTISGMTVVDEWGTLNRLEVKGDPSNGQWSKVYLEGTNREITFRGGRVAGILAMRDERIEQVMDDLNELARSLIEAFNAIHMEGYGLNGEKGGPFFDGDDARSIRLHEDILDPQNGLARIAAALTQDAAGDGENALRLANLRMEKIARNRTSTLADLWSGLVSGLGVDAQKATFMVESQTVVVGHLERQREAVAGVNLDEEMADMIRYQHAYQAAARVITTVDELLETLILRTGLVGRG